MDEISATPDDTTIEIGRDEQAYRKARLIEADDAFKKAVLAAHPEMKVGVAAPDPLRQPRPVTRTGCVRSLIGSSAAMCTE